MGGHQPLDASTPPALPPPPNRPSAESVVPARGGGPVLPRILQHPQAIPHPRPILRPHLHVAELDHGPPLGLDRLDAQLPIKAKEVNLEQILHCPYTGLDSVARQD